MRSPLRCPIRVCPERFTWLPYLVEHILRNGTHPPDWGHAFRKPLICIFPNCKRHFITLSDLNQHFASGHGLPVTIPNGLHGLPNGLYKGLSEGVLEPLPVR